MKDTGWMATNQHKRKDELEYWLTEHLRLNGVYWGLTALHILGHPDTLPRDQTIDFVLSCQSENGGFGAAPGHDAHMLYTVSAVQILVTIDAVDELDKRDRGGKEKVGSCMTFPHTDMNDCSLIHYSHCKPTKFRWLLHGRPVGRNRYPIFIWCPQCIVAIASNGPGRCP